MATHTEERDITVRQWVRVTRCDTCGREHVRTDGLVGRPPGWFQLVMFGEQPVAAEGSVDFCSWGCLQQLVSRSECSFFELARVRWPDDR